MKTLLATIGIVLVVGSDLPCAAQSAPASAAAPAAAEPNPANLAIAREIVTLIMPPENAQAMMDQMSDALYAQMREALSRSAGNLPDPSAQPLWDRYLERVRAATRDLDNEYLTIVNEVVAKAYARIFTLDDLVQIRTFASTPAGRRYFRQSMDIFNDPDVAEANRTYMERAFPIIQRAMLEAQREIEAQSVTQPRR